MELSWGRFDEIDRKVTHWMAESGVTLLRLAIALVYIWFGLPKLFPGLSPAEPLIKDAYAWLPFATDLFVRVVGIMEVLIGIGFLIKPLLRITLLVMAFQILGTLSPMILAPERVFQVFPIALTMEGQFMVKNAVLIAAALVVGATVRGGGLTEKPEVMAVDQALEKGGDVVEKVEEVVEQAEDRRTKPS